MLTLALFNEKGRRGERRPGGVTAKPQFAGEVLTSFGYFAVKTAGGSFPVRPDPLRVLITERIGRHCHTLTPCNQFTAPPVWPSGSVHSGAKVSGKARTDSQDAGRRRCHCHCLGGAGADSPPAPWLDSGVLSPQPEPSRCNGGYRNATVRCPARTTLTPVVASRLEVAFSCVRGHPAPRRLSFPGAKYTETLAQVRAHHSAGVSDNCSDGRLKFRSGPRRGATAPAGEGKGR